jgi:hypothetical protein
MVNFKIKLKMKYLFESIFFICVVFETINSMNFNYKNSFKVSQLLIYLIFLNFL